MGRLVVGMGECRATNDPQVVLITYALGSCVGVTMYDSLSAVGGLLHFMLPNSSLDPELGQQRPSMFADTGMALLLKRMCAEGAHPGRLVACIAGAAQILDDPGIFEIGKRNYLAARQWLSRHGIALEKEDVGGSGFRTLRLEIATGRVLLHELGKPREFQPAPLRRGGSLRRIVT